MNLVERLIEADHTTPKRILIVGDVMTDLYIRGHVEGKCQEGCSKFIEEERVTVPGGAANAARSLRNWYTTTTLVGGDIEKGPTKTRFMDENHECIFRHDYEYFNPTLSKISSEALHQLQYGPQPVSMVLLSDYDKGALTPAFIWEVAKTCSNLGIPCVADVKREPKTYEGCILKGNLDWYTKHGRANIVTLGQEPPVVNGETCWLKLPLVRCVNHIGAGDCFAAHLTLALAHRFSLQDAALIAHSAGRVYVQHHHNRPPRPEEIAKDIMGERNNS